jgi:hypothetical protein
LGHVRRLNVQSEPGVAFQQVFSGDETGRNVQNWGHV